jgi:hypothetical protein
MISHHSKATPKRLQRKLQSIKPLKIKGFIKFFGVLEWTPKKYISKPYPTQKLARFLQGGGLFFLYISLSLQKLQKQKSKINQIIERVALEGFGVFFGVALEWFWSFFHSCKKQVITKHRPAPPSPTCCLLRQT